MNERKSSIRVISNKRKDGKYKVRIVYPGSANAFGGFYPNKVFTKLFTAQQIADHIKPWIDAYNLPSEVSELIGSQS